MNTSVPVALLHGFASSFDHGWARQGWPDFLDDLGRGIVPAELLGHGASERPHDPSRYGGAVEHFLAQLPEVPVDAVGFSAGAVTLLRAATKHPDRFRRLVLLGVGDGLLASTRQPEALGLIEALSHDVLPSDADSTTKLFRRMAESERNDRHALVAFLRGFPGSVDEGALAAVAMPTLLVVGDRDRANPATRLTHAIPNGELLVVAGLDHFMTPSDFRVVDAALAFIAA